VSRVPQLSSRFSVEVSFSRVCFERFSAQIVKGRVDAPAFRPHDDFQWEAYDADPRPPLPSPLLLFTSFPLCWTLGCTAVFLPTPLFQFTCEGHSSLVEVVCRGSLCGGHSFHARYRTTSSFSFWGVEPFLWCRPPPAPAVNEILAGLV